MKFLISLPLLLLISFNALSAGFYKCEDADGRMIFSDTPCERKVNDAQNTDQSGQKEVLSGERLDKAMWVLLEEPYKSDEQKFIDHVKTNDLLSRRDSVGNTVLSAAAINDQVGVIEYLLDNGVNINTVNNAGYSIFSFATKYSDPVKKILVLRGANIDHIGDRGHTPLINAVLSNDLDTVKFLLRRDAKIDHLDQKGSSALFFAASQGNMEIVKSLVEAGADVNVGTQHKPLRAAISGQHLTVSTYLKSRGAAQ